MDLFEILSEFLSENFNRKFNFIEIFTLTSEKCFLNFDEKLIFMKFWL